MPAVRSTARPLWVPFEQPRAAPGSRAHPHVRGAAHGGRQRPHAGLHFVLGPRPTTGTARDGRQGREEFVAQQRPVGLAEGLARGSTGPPSIGGWQSRTQRASEASPCDSMMEAGRPSGRARAKQVLGPTAYASWRCSDRNQIGVTRTRVPVDFGHPAASVRWAGGSCTHMPARGLMTRRGRAVGSVRTERTGHEPHGLLLASVTQRDKRARFCSQFSLRPIATRPYGNYAWKLRRHRMTSTRASAECLA